MGIGKTLWGPTGSRFELKYLFFMRYCKIFIKSNLIRTTRALFWGTMIFNKENHVFSSRQDSSSLFSMKHKMKLNFYYINPPVGLRRNSKAFSSEDTLCFSLLSSASFSFNFIKMPWCIGKLHYSWLLSPSLSFSLKLAFFCIQMKRGERESKWKANEWTIERWFFSSALFSFD